MNQKSNKIAVCFFAAAILAGTGYVFLNYMPPSDSPQEEAEKENEMFITMTPEQIQSEEIQIQRAGPGNLQNKIYASGRIIFNSTNLMHIVPKASGIVKEANKNIGDSVSKGEVLVLLDSLEMAEAKSSLIDKINKERIAQRNLERERKLLDKNISSEQEWLNKQAEADQAELELELAKQKLHVMGLPSKEIDQIEQAKTPIRQYELRSPISGKIMDKKIVQGEHLNTEDEVYVIADLNTLGVELNVFPQDADYLSEGQEVDIACPYGSQCRGTIVSIGPQIDPDTHTLSVYAEIDNPNSLWKPGAYISAAIKTSKEKASVVVPKEALQKIDAQDCVFVVKEQGFEIRPVKKGRSDESHVEILSGLSPDEPIASTNTFILKADHGKNEAQHMD